MGPYWRRRTVASCALSPREGFTRSWADRAGVVCGRAAKGLLGRRLPRLALEATPGKGRTRRELLTASSEAAIIETRYQLLGGKLSASESSASRVLRALREAGYRITAARRAVVEAVLGRDRQFTGADIVAQVAAPGRSVGRATVFRTLEVLVDLGVVGRVHTPGGGQGYVLCPQGHHHHAICSRCGLVVDLPGCPLDGAAEREARLTGFRLQGHRLEYYGLCLTCQDKGTG